MAQAIPEKDDSPHQASLSLSSITECPVCLDTLRKPRSLPCRHTFCLGCLETYIAKVTTNTVADDTHASPPSLPCPVCRTLVLPPTTSVDGKQWARQFPTNTFVLEILEKRNKEIEDTCKCSPCQSQDKDVDGTLFCKQCSFFMCTLCKSSLHDIIHTDHHVVGSAGGQHETRQTISEEVLC
ncbi:tripartite motif-containing protein 10-like [Mizuhopecten yessoensis]|uniref:tripartite motif-containing protein 10-like n=1 Tax=Mizuhopecten yessoensis TaxID=6573 RepID=UPI000B45CCEC|nr:tripartite motif-containing protein 10-like [Mizuhopecten yessoensis]